MRRLRERLAGLSRGAGPMRDLLPVEAIGRDGVVLRSDGALVRLLAVCPLSPQAMSGADVARVSAGFVRLAERLAHGDSLQLCIDVAPASLDELVDVTRRERAASLSALQASGPDGRAEAGSLGRLTDAHVESIALHAGDGAAVSDVRAYVVVPHFPRRRRPRGDRRAAIRESLLGATTLRGELRRLGVDARLLDGAEVARLVYRRVASAAEGADDPPIEVLGELDERDEAEAAARVADDLQRQLELSALDFGTERYIRVDRDLEQVIYVAGSLDEAPFGWLFGAIAPGERLTLSVHVHAADPLDEPGDARFELAIYQALRERGPDADPVRLAERVDAAARTLSAASRASVHRGEFMQEDLWTSTLPLGLDGACLTRGCDRRALGHAFPLVRATCGSPAGVPFAIGRQHGTVERLDPHDPAHADAGMTIVGAPGSGVPLVANVALSRLLASGVAGAAIDATDRHAFLCDLLPDAERVAIGAGEHAVNPWDMRDSGRDPALKAGFLVALHELLLAPGDGLDAPGRELLESAVRAVCARAGHERRTPGTGDLRDELAARSERAATADGDRLRYLAASVAELIEDDGFAAVLARPTSVRDRRLLVFDTSAVPDALAPAVALTLVERALASGRPRTVLVGEASALVGQRAGAAWLADAAWRARRSGSFLVLATERPGDLATAHGRALVRRIGRRLLLAAPADALAGIAGALGLTATELAAIERMEAAQDGSPGAYWVNGARGRAAVTIGLAPTERWLAATDATDDVARRSRAVSEHGGDAWAAVDELVGAA